MCTVQLAFDTSANRTVYNALKKNKIVPCVMCGHLNLIVSRFPFTPSKTNISPPPPQKKVVISENVVFQPLFFQGTRRGANKKRPNFAPVKFAPPNPRKHHLPPDNLSGWSRCLLHQDFFIGKNSCCEIKIWWCFFLRKNGAK